ncbi:hypothetical protein IQ249_22900 [Lusitaniella coriacea LEGE 07157]|uniref:Uncharacterized protein n=2 Tax=Lusitaniella TaxID=1983104 RepID=A0A8J7E1D5_9CYAN|nr:hypothetical protein [Lusitaniella coriacea LEGE 07157]
MKFIKILIAASFLGLGLGLFIVGLEGLIDENTKSYRERTHREQVYLGGVMTAVASTVLGWTLYQEREKYKAQQLETEREKFLLERFYQVLEAKQGRITTLQLAMAAKLSPKDVQAFLDEQAKELKASVDVTPEGKTYYQFDV